MIFWRPAGSSSAPYSLPGGCTPDIQSPYHLQAGLRHPNGIDAIPERTLMGRRGQIHSQTPAPILQRGPFLVGGGVCRRGLQHRPGMAEAIFEVTTSARNAAGQRRSSKTRGPAQCDPGIDQGCAPNPHPIRAFRSSFMRKSRVRYANRAFVPSACTWDSLRNSTLVSGYSPGWNSLPRSQYTDGLSGACQRARRQSRRRSLDPDDDVTGSDL